MKKILLISALISLTGCVSNGTIMGVSQGQNVSFDYEQSMFENGGKLRITMPDGEQYSGKFVPNSTSTSGSDFGFVSDSSSFDDFGEFTSFSDSTSISSVAEAILIGDRGNTMKCRFQLSDPDSGMNGGGIGDCKTSKNQNVAVSF